MFNSLLSSRHVSILESALSASSLRHKVISDNIANVNTPGFKKSEVIFEEKLQQALNGKTSAPLARTHLKHLPIQMNSGDISPTINNIANTTMRSDGNNVDIDIEMANMSKNNIYYNAVAQQLSRHFSDLKTIIRG